MAESEWGNIRVPKSVIDEINKRIEKDPNFKKMGWKTYSGFANYIIMRELDRYAKVKK
jgi:hypothetical protein